MMNEPEIAGAGNKADPQEAPRKLSAAAKRALREAEERRAIREAAANEMPREIGGRKGPEPVRFGDWEVKGIATDF